MLVSIAQAIALTLLGWPFGEAGGRIYLCWKRREKWTAPVQHVQRMLAAELDESFWWRNASAVEVYDRGAYARSVEYGSLDH